MAGLDFLDGGDLRLGSEAFASAMEWRKPWANTGMGLEVALPVAWRKPQSSTALRGPPLSAIAFTGESATRLYALSDRPMGLGRATATLSR